MTQQERLNRIIARGEHSDHAHVIVGDATILNDNEGRILVTTGNEGAVLMHIIESAWLKGDIKWTNEHYEIDLKPNTSYEFIQQQEYSPLDKIVQNIMD